MRSYWILNIVIGECVIEENFLSYIQVVVRIEGPQAIFNVFNRKEITKNVHEIEYWQLVSMEVAMES